MDIRPSDHFDAATLSRAGDYARRGLVLSVEPQDGVLVAQVSNGRGTTYMQRIVLADGRLADGWLADGWLAGECTCPVGQNCKHVAAALMVWAAKGPPECPGLAPSVQSWLRRVQEVTARARQRDVDLEVRPDDYPDTVKDRLLYVLAPEHGRLRIEVCKGRMNAAGTALNKSIRRYDAAHALRSAAPAKFLRPVDLELLSALAQMRLWEANYGYGLPDPLRLGGEKALALVQGLCATGRLLSDAAPDARLDWSDDRPEARLAWRMATDGRQRLVFEAQGSERQGSERQRSERQGSERQGSEGEGFAGEGDRTLRLMALDGATLWVDAGAGRIGALAGVIDAGALAIVEASPQIAPSESEALGAALPATLDGLAVPRPHRMRQRTRTPRRRVARLTLGREGARDGPGYFAVSVELPTLTLRFAYDGHEVGEEHADPRIVEGGEVVTLARDRNWEAACVERLMGAGALLVEELDAHWPGERMLDCDFVFASGEIDPRTLEVSHEGTALDFAFREVPELRREGWEVVETPRWPYRLSEETAKLAVATRAERGMAFGGSDWFSFGFQAEIGGEAVDVAPLVAAFLEQMRGQQMGGQQMGGEWTDGDAPPDAEAMAAYLADHPVYLDRGASGYAVLDLSPLAPLLRLFLAHHAEMGALHPSEANAVRRVEDALAGSDVRFADHAGILPLARSLGALAEIETAPPAPPSGLKATLRDYQARGAAWMGGLLEAGFGGVLADDMGLGKTVQALALLQARREAGAPGPALLVVPTSLLHGWQDQAARFTPDLRLVVLHGPDRAARREDALGADLVVTTYPLLARDREWLAARDWPLVILDEAQTLKNPASVTAKALREMPARGRLALTGTPLENSLHDLWTLIDWVNPGLLGDRKAFGSLFRVPIEKHGDAAAQARLNRRLRPFLLRRTKEAVAAELPPRTEILERIDLPKAQQALYETVRCAMDVRVRAAIDARGLSGARITVLDALLKLRQVCCDPALVKTAAARTVADSAKRARLRELLAELTAEGRRVLVFSQFVGMLRLIEADLEAAGIPCLTLTGKTKDRAGVLERFAGGEAPVFLLSLKAGGVGLTLTEADTVILYDPWWNPAVERQAMDRAHRIGQTKPVFVHRLVAAGTVEERILDMQARKRALADALFEGETNSEGGTSGEGGRLDEATLHDLFAPLNA